MAIVDSLMHLRRTIMKSAMDTMPEVVMLFPDHRSKDIFVHAIHRELGAAAPHMNFNGERIQIAGINLVIGVR